MRRSLPRPSTSRGRTSCAILLRYLALSACSLTLGCNSITVKPPECDLLLPKPSALPCQLPADLVTGQFGEVFISKLKLLSQYRECIKNYGLYKAQTEVRDKACQDLRNRVQESNKHWWEK